MLLKPSFDSVLYKIPCMATAFSTSFRHFRAAGIDRFSFMGRLGPDIIYLGQRRRPLHH